MKSKHMPQKVNGKLEDMPRLESQVNKYSN